MSGLDPHNIAVDPPTSSSASDSPLDTRCFPFPEPLALLLERHGDGIMYCDATGHAQHCNPAMTGALDATPRGERLRREVAEFIEDLRRDGAQLHQRVVRTREGRCLLEGGCLAGSGYLVVLRLGSQHPLDAPHLQDRFGLSDQETRVLCLLVEGRSNREIAHTLRLSEHTVRHHIEHILLKLHVRSRAAAVARVLRG